VGTLLPAPTGTVDAEASLRMADAPPPYTHGYLDLSEDGMFTVDEEVTAGCLTGRRQ